MPGGNLQIVEVDTKGKWSLFLDDRGGDKLDFPTNCAFGGSDRQTPYIDIANSQATTSVASTRRMWGTGFTNSADIDDGPDALYLHR